MDGHFCYLQRLLKNRKKSDSFAANFVQHFNTTTSRTDLRKYMKFKVVKHLNPLRISYHGFNNLAELLNGDLAVKIGQGIFSKDLMDRKYNCFLPSKFKGKSVYEGKCRS